MKLILSLTLATAALLCSCGTPTSRTSTASTLAADTAIAVHVATQYELAAQDHAITPADYFTIAQEAVDQYALSHPGADTATLKSWLTTATDAVKLYDLSRKRETKTKPSPASAFVLPPSDLPPVCAFDPAPPGLPVTSNDAWRIAFALPGPQR